MHSTSIYEQHYPRGYRSPKSHSDEEKEKQEVKSSFPGKIPKQLEYVLPLFNKMPAGLIALSPAAEVLWANSHFINMTGMNGATVKWPFGNGLFAKECLSELKALLQPKVAAPQEEEIEARLRLQPGKEISVRLRRLPLPLPFQQEKICLLSVEHSSEQQAQVFQLEKALAEAQASNSAQQHLLASMSHEIRNSVNVVSGIIHCSSNGHLSHKEIQHLQYVADHLLHLTENFLYHSRIREGQLRLVNTAFNFRELLSSLAQAPAALLRNGEVGFEFYQDPQLPVYCIGDKTAIYQIILNLLGNALKFTSEGSVSLLVNRKEKEAGGKVIIHFQVKDTGPGIPGSQLEAIFDHFNQGEASAKNPIKGYGLGLAISRQLAGLMGGHITVESKVGKGSTFEVQIPLEEASAIQAGRPVRPSSSYDAFQCSTPIRVLVLEDDPLSRFYLESFLQKEGVAYHSCSNGQEALHALEGHSFDLALLDIHTPLLNGFEVAANLRHSRDNPNWCIPIIALSGGQFEPGNHQLMEAGISHFLEKPYCLEELKHLLRLHAIELQKRQGHPRFHFSEGFDRKELDVLYGENYAQIQSMFEVFLRNVPKVVDNMSEMLRREDWKSLAGQAHKAKPSFMLVGWRPVASLAKQLEEECLNSKDKILIERKFHRLRIAAETVVEAIIRENQRLTIFQANHTPPTHAYPDRR